jgi:uncharacterized protein (DUF885 family)
MKRKILLVLAVLLFIGAIWVINLIWFKPFSIRHFYDRILVEMMVNEPEVITMFRIPVLYNLTRSKLTDVSDEASWRRFERSRKAHQTLLRYDFARQSDANQLNTRILDAFLQDILDGEPFFYHSYVLDQINGVHVSLPNLMQTMHRMDNRRDVEAYIARLNLFGRKFDQVITKLQLRADKGIILPDFIISQIIADIHDFIGDDFDTAESDDPALQRVLANPLYTGFIESLDGIDNLSHKRKEDYQKRASDAISNNVLPAYERLAEYLEGKLEMAGPEAGVWKHPDGDAYYAYMVRMQTTTELTPAQIHQLGLDEVERIQAEIREILTAEGYSFDGVLFGEVLRELSEEDRFLFEDSEEGRTQILEGYRSIVEDITAQLNEYFDLMPKAGVEVQPVPSFMEAASPFAYYNPPAMDGSRGGVFFTNLRDVSEHPVFFMKTLTYHEANPGHHFQIAIQMELSGLPLFRRMIPFGTYLEGWAMYAERLAWEMGMYDDDPFGNVGRLQAELFRAVRLVVDTGIHYKRWTREEANDYLQKHTGLSITQVATEIDRYIIWPGQAVTYTVGLLKMLELRDKARVAVGEQFDIRKFHNVLLQHGALHLGILEEKVDAFIQSMND